jgi:hypothetical protein
VRDSVTAVGFGCTMVGLLLALASRGAHNWLLWGGQILIALGFVLLLVKLWKRRQS